ncbi:PiggyBac transposable element-derived 4 [Phytophthora oleae]|uniref:PiggyBac transposable element-derived 4 n=1 Tax=Phytophthora oleae TaxID=2107226 RepID=A0ABD3ESF5_9STRA
MRTEKLFGPVSADDVNMSRPFRGDDEVESENDAVGVPAGIPDAYESEVESDDEFEDDSNMFEQDDDAMRTMSATGWDLYDDHHSGELQVPGADDLYAGTWGPTRSAAA